jgi:pre-mRNA-splicing factor ATP-dependent RNA helicase DHX16
MIQKTQQDTSALLKKRIEEDEKKRQESINTLRDYSRYEYLRKREEQRLLLLEKEIQDEEALFYSEKLTKKEQKDLEMKKKVLALAKERASIDEKEQGYVMPDEYYTESGKIDKKKKESVLYQRYEESATKRRDVSEQQSWEQEKIGKSLARTGALNRDSKEDEFSFVFDEEQRINFIKAKSLEKAQKVSEGPQLSEKDKQTLSMKEIRDSLPIFSYREQLLDAIQQFQTLIIVGETGSGKVIIN